MKAFLKRKRWQQGLFQPFYRVLWQVYNAYRFVVDAAYRSRIISQRKYKEAYHQFSNFTSYNRYPDLFSILQTRFKNQKSVKILSYGCSTGEEVYTLNTYLPQATIIGVDINKWCLRQAHKNYSSDKNHFFHSLSTEFQQQTEFDAILCLAVFQNPENRHNPSQQLSSYPFSKFEEQLIELNKKLKIGGWLIIDQTDFNFLETTLLSQYKIAKVEPNRILRSRPLYNKNNQRVCEIQQNFRVFEKIK